MASTITRLGYSDEFGGEINVISIDDTTVFKNVDNGATKLKALYLKNSHAANPAYVHLWDSIAPVLGTTPQDHEYVVEANTVPTPIIFADDEDFANGLSIACTSDNGTAAITAPSAAVEIIAVTIPASS